MCEYVEEPDKDEVDEPGGIGAVQWEHRGHHRRSISSSGGGGERKDR